MEKICVKTNFGISALWVDQGALVRLALDVDAADADLKSAPISLESQKVVEAVQAYAIGDMAALGDIPVRFSAGTTFQQKVWHALRKIPYGEVITYGELARRVGSSPRAVGGAVGKNPVPLVVPCHRVVSKGGLGGFSGGKGLKTKIKLLKHEGCLI